MWHYIANGETKGPFELSAIRELIAGRRIERNTLVWRPGLAEWKEAIETALASEFEAVPPPIPVGSGTTGQPIDGMPPPLPAERRVIGENQTKTGYSSYKQFSLNNIKSWLIGFYISYIVVRGISVFAYLGQIGVLEQIRDGELSGAEAIQEAEAVDAFTIFTNALGFVIGMVALVLFLVWKYRAMANLHRAGAAVSIEPAWAIGWYFVPIANLWKPLQAMSQLYRASRNPQAPASVAPNGVLGWWWGVSLAAAFFISLGGLIGSASQDIGSVQADYMFQLIGAGFEVAGVFLVMSIIRSIVGHQRAKGLSADPVVEYS